MKFYLQVKEVFSFSERFELFSIYFTLFQLFLQATHRQNSCFRFGVFFFVSMHVWGSFVQVCNVMCVSIVCVGGEFCEWVVSESCEW